jgi:hypothetical protein
LSKLLHISVGLEKSFGINNIRVEKSWMRYYLIIEWPVESSHIFVESLKIALPTKVPIGMFSAKKLNVIKNTNLLVTMLLIDDKNIAHQMGCQLYTPSDFEMLTVEDNKVQDNTLSLKEKKRLLLQRQ